MTKRKALPHLSGLDKQDGTLMQMVQEGIPLTRANYLARIYDAEGPPDEVPAEVLAELPPYFDEPEDDL